MNPPELRYTEEHEWVRLDGEEAVFGITDHAQAELGDVVYVDLPAAGTKTRKGEKFGEIESVKAVSDLFAPLTGEVLAANEDLVESPERVNEEPYGAGWMLRVRPADPAELDSLLTAEQYESFIRDG
jgi:glycine cleavage system H protein